MCHRAARPSCAKQCCAMPKKQGQLAWLQAAGSAMSDPEEDVIGPGKLGMSCHKQGHPVQMSKILSLLTACDSASFSSASKMHLDLSKRCLAKTYVTTGMQQQAVSDEHQASELAPGQPGHRKSDRKEPVIILEGQPIYLDKPEGSASDVPSYRRYKVSCPCAHHRDVLEQPWKNT